MNNCYVNICGGVGNQLFQIATGYAYAKKHGKKLIINPYNWSASQGTNPLVYKDSIFKNFEYDKPDEKAIPINEKRFNYDELPFYEGSVVLNGYFQSLKYFEEYKDEFISLLKLPEVNIPTYPSVVNIAFHIRRGDYINHAPIHYVCDTNYFNKMFDIFTPEIVKGTKIIVFTDSPEIVLEEFKDKEFTIMKSESDIKELAFMSKCDIVVGSNSTFSWWAALIGGNDTNYFPSKWFADGREATDIYHDKIIKCDV